MEKAALTKKLEELVEAIKNINDSRHNPSYELEEYARDLFDKLIDEVTN